MSGLPAHLPRLLTAVETREALRVDAEGLRDLVTSGKIRAGRTPGGAPRYFAEDVEAILRTREQL